MGGSAEDADLLNHLQKVVADFAGSKHTASDIERLLDLEVLDQAQSLARRIHSEGEPGPDFLNELVILGWFHWYRFQLLLPEAEGEALALEDFQLSLSWFSSVNSYAPQVVPQAVRALLQERRAATGLSSAGEAVAIAFEHYEAFTRTGETIQIDVAIDHLRRAATATPASHPARAGYLSNLGVALRLRFERAGTVGDVDEAIDVGREAVMATPASHPALPAMFSNLGTALQVRFQRNGTVGDVDEAIENARKAVVATPARHPNHAMYLSNLGVALQVRFVRFGAVGDLDEAIDVGREAVAATPAPHAERAGYLSNLGLALRQRFERTGAISDVDEAIGVGREAVAATPVRHPDHPMYLSNLGIALQVRFVRFGAVGDVNEAIDIVRKAVAATPVSHPSRSKYLTSLGTALQVRFQSIGMVSDLDEAIDVARAVVEAIPAGHAARPGCLSNLALALRLRYERAGVIGDVNEAIVVGREALVTTPVDDAELAGYLSNLGIALRLRFEQGVGLVGDLNEAIRLTGEAVAVTPAGHAELAGYLSNLGIVLRLRFERGGPAGDLDKAIDTLRKAVAATPHEPQLAGRLSHLGIALRLRFERDQAAGDLGEATDCFRAAVGVESVAPYWRVHAYRWLGDVQRLAGERPDIVAASFRRAVVLHSEEVAPRMLDWQDQEHLLGEHTGLAADAIAVHLDANDLYGALEVAELGRAVLLSYATEDRSDLATLRELDSELAKAFETALSELSNIKASIERRQQAETQRGRLLSYIRSLPGMNSFLGTPPAQELLDGLPAEGHVVLVNVSDLRCDVLLCSRGAEPVPIALARLAAADVRDQVVNLLGAMQDPRPLAGQKRRQRVIGEVLAWLWDTTVAPVLDHLPTTDSTPRIWWVPTGLMAALPLHAATPRSGPGALERTVSSYAPNIRSLTGPHQFRARGSWQMLVASLPKTPAIPSDGRRPARPAAKDLPGTTAEAEALRSPGLLPPGLTVDDLSGARASLGAVTDGLREATWAHLACHGDADPAQPSKGRLLLYDGDLTIPELARLRLNHAQLAYLSACSTAVGGLRQADEVITVATAFRIAGFRHVIGTLWPLGDDVAPVAAKLFYETLSNLLQNEPESDDGCYAQALHRTVTELRNQGFKAHQWAQLVHIGP